MNLKRVGRHSAIAFATQLILVVSATAAYAAVDGSGTIGAHQLRVDLQVRMPGGGLTDARDAGAPSPFRIDAVAAKDHTGPLLGECPVPGVPGPDLTGWWWHVKTIDNATGVVISTVHICLPMPSASSPEPLIPAPPTIGEIWAAAGLPGPSLGLSPLGEGVTGLDTWIWGASPNTIQIAATIDGYTITGSAHVARYTFDTGDGTTYDSVGSGNADNPALLHMYERTGTYPLSIAAVWTATVAISGPGFAARPTPIGEALETGTYDYPVVQVRSVITA